MIPPGGMGFNSLADFIPSKDDFDKELIPDEVLRTEFNKKIIGGVVALVYGANKEDDGTAMMTRCMLEDISFHGIWEDWKFYDSVFRKVWDTFEKYNLDSAWCRRYYEQDEVKSSNPQIAVTYYQCTSERFLLVAGNTSETEQETVVDLNRLKPGDYTIFDEFNKKEIVTAQESVFRIQESE